MDLENTIKNVGSKIKKGLAIGAIALSALVPVYGQNTTKEHQMQRDAIATAYPIVQEYIENEEMSPTNELGTALESYIFALAQKHGLEYTGDSAYNTQDHTFLREKIAPREQELQNFEGSLTRTEISTLQNLAIKYVQGLDSHQNSNNQQKILGTQPKREIHPENKWNAILDAQTIDEVVDIVGGVSVAYSQIQEAKHSKLTKAQLEEISQRIYSATIYSILDNATKGLESYTPENAAILIENTNINYLNSIGETDAIRKYPDNLPRDTRLKLSKALELGSSEIAKLSQDLFSNYQNEDLPKRAVERIQDLGTLLTQINNSNKAADYMNAKHTVKLNQPFMINPPESYQNLGTISSGNLFSIFNEFKNSPNIEISIADLIRLNLEYSDKTGQIFLQDANDNYFEHNIQEIENYFLNQKNLEIDGSINVFNFLKESNKDNLNLWLGIGYRKRQSNQEFDGEEISELKNIEQGYNLSIKSESQYNNSIGGLVGLDAFFKITHFNNDENNWDASCGVNFNIKQFSDHTFMGMNAGFDVDTDPSEYMMGNAYIGIDLGAYIKKTYLELTAKYSIDSLNLGLNIKH